MKKIIFSIVALVILGLNSCKKDAPNTGLSEEIIKIVPQAILDDMKAKGMTINEGQVPPSMEGIFTVAPMELLSSYGPNDSWKKGKIIDGYTYKFSNQSSKKKTVILEYKSNGGSDRGDGIGSFVAGNGNRFTIFAEVKGQSSGVDYVMLRIISGEVSNKGIKNFQMSLYMKEKSEGTGLGALIPVNTGRIWFDNDLMSERGNSFRIGVDTKNKADKSDNSAVSNARP